MAFFRKAANLLGKTANAHVSPSRLSVFQVMRYMSSSKIFVGGLSYNTDDMSLREAFDKYGEVAEARVIVDRETGRSRGFGFVTYSSTEEASAAIQALDQQDLHGRRIRVNYANDRTRGGGYGGGGYGGGYGGGGYGGGSGYGGGGGYGGGNAGGYGADGSTNYNSGVGSLGNSGGTNLYDGQSFDGGLGGAGGSDNYSGGADSGNGGYGAFGGRETNDMHSGHGLGQNQPETDYRYDDETTANYADRRG